MTTKAQSQLTRKQRAWAYKHAKDHFVEALQEVLTDEHHSFVRGYADDGTELTQAQRDTIHAVVMEHMERWFKAIRKERARDYA